MINQPLRHIVAALYFDVTQVHRHACDQSQLCSEQCFRACIFPRLIDVYSCVLQHHNYESEVTMSFHYLRCSTLMGLYMPLPFMFVTDLLSFHLNPRARFSSRPCLVIDNRVCLHYRFICFTQWWIK